MMAHLDRTFSRPAERPAENFDRFCAARLRKSIQDQSVLDLIEFKGLCVMRSEIRQAHIQPPVKILWLSASTE
jgi:hypothetical protein